MDCLIAPLIFGNVEGISFLTPFRGHIICKKNTVRFADPFVTNAQNGSTN